MKQKQWQPPEVNRSWEHLLSLFNLNIIQRAGIWNNTSTSYCSFFYFYHSHNITLKQHHLEKTRSHLWWSSPHRRHLAFLDTVSCSAAYFPPTQVCQWRILLLQICFLNLSLTELLWLCVMVKCFCADWCCASTLCFDCRSLRNNKTKIISPRLEPIVRQELWFWFCDVRGGVELVDAAFRGQSDNQWMELITSIQRLRCRQQRSREFLNVFTLLNKNANHSFYVFTCTHEWGFFFSFFCVQNKTAAAKCEKMVTDPRDASYWLMN